MLNKFSTFTPEVRTMLNQTLAAAIVRANEAPTMFSIYGENIVPTTIEAAHVTELLRNTLNYQEIFYGTETMVAEAMRSVADNIEIWIDGRDPAQSEEEAMQDYYRMSGINVDKDTVKLIRGFARNLCPHGEISNTRQITSLDSPAFSELCMSFNTQLVSKPEATVGLVVDNVMFELPINHPIMTSIFGILNKRLRTEAIGEAAI